MHKTLYNIPSGGGQVPRAIESGGKVKTDLITCTGRFAGLLVERTACWATNATPGECT